MTQLKVDTITDAAGTAAPDFEDGLTVAGSAISTLNLAEYYESGSEPSSPKNGAIWKDTANDKVMMYVNSEWREIELGASGVASWTVDLSNVTYDNVSFSTASQTSSTRMVLFNTDGTKMYVGCTGTDSIFQYSLSTGFDITTASYDSKSFSFASQDTAPLGFALSADGTKMYMSGASNDSIFQYSLSTAFDVSTASYDSVSFAVQDNFPQDVTFNNDGTKFYIVGSEFDEIREYSLSTAWDLSTASYNSVSLSTVGNDTVPSGLTFNPEGTKLYFIGSGSDRVRQFSLSTAFDLSTASDDNINVSVSSQDLNPRGVTFSNDGTKMYISGDSSDAIYQYSTGL